ncbi:MAG: hypothetical protein JNL41_10000 [Phenylobacterium sp.]|uniref:hypothetical protein n=1 Tax=Phenylobacterium sp. TaxID=1871053 RepID=UPI001A5DD860|nr:hypothetical protein [Phenylobacterium sp.]MBL8554598.1 hypothetical protein [Phenylobacterium sp.]
MAERRGDVVILTDEERAELDRLREEIPAAYARAGALFREATMKEFIEADAYTGKLLRRWKELMGE